MWAESSDTRSRSLAKEDSVFTVRKKNCEPARAAGKAFSFRCQFDLGRRHGGVRMTRAVAIVFFYENQPDIPRWNVPTFRF